MNRLFREPIAETLESRRLLAGQIYPQQGTNAGAFASLSTVADFNEDGHLDVASTDYSHGLAVSLGRGDGTFAPARIAPALYSIFGSLDMESGDFNRDGHVDVAVVEQSSKRVHVFLGDGIGGVSVGDVYFVGIRDGWADIEVGDLNSDLKLDLVVTGLQSSSIKTLLGNGDGTFQAATEISLGTLKTSAISLVDMSADGILDIVAAPAGTRPLVILKGDGLGGFLPRTEINFNVSGANARAMQAADLNNDGWIDIVMSTGSNVAILPATGPASFGSLIVHSIPPPSIMWAGAAVDNLQVGDLDGNGWKDIVLTQWGGQGRVLLNNGLLSTLAKPDAFALPYLPDGMRLADFDEDDVSDLVWSNPTSHSFCVSLGRGDGTFRTPLPIPMGTTDLRSVQSADLNADGRDDWIVTTGDSQPTRIYLSGSDGSMTLKTSYPAFLNPRLGDFNGDSKVDFLHQSGTSFTLYLGLNDGTFVQQATASIPFSNTFVTAEDLNLDGVSDLRSSTEVAFGSPSGSFALPMPIDPVPVGYQLIASIDINGDQLRDRVLVKSNELWLSSAMSATSFSVPVFSGAVDLPIGGNASVGYGNTGDFDGNGTVDVTFNYTTTTFDRVQQTLLNNGDGTFSLAPTPYVWPRNSGSYSQAVRDLNDDGFPDLVGMHSVNGSQVDYWFALLNDTHGQFVERISLFTDPDVDADNLAFGDFNGDGKLDYVVLFGVQKSAIIYLNQLGLDTTSPTVVNTSHNLAIDNTVTFHLSEAVRKSTTKPSDIQLLNLTANQTVTLSNYEISADGKTLTATLPLTLAPGDYRVRLPRNSVVDAAGNPLLSHVDIPSLFWMPGDANRDRAVNFDDLLILAQNYGQAGRTFGQGNVNYSADGLVDFEDLLLLAQRYGTSLFSASPIAKRGRGRAADLLI